jgi:hypothetical protein
MADEYVSQEVRYIKELIKAIDQYPSYVAPSDVVPGDDIYRLQMDPREYLLEYLYDRINESTINIVKDLANIESENISWNDNRLLDVKKDLFSELELIAIDNFMTEYLSDGEAHLVMNGGKKRKSRKSRKSKSTKKRKSRKSKSTRKRKPHKSKPARKRKPHKLTNSRR